MRIIPGTKGLYKLALCSTLLPLGAFSSTASPQSSVSNHATNLSEALPPYRNASLCVKERVEDLLSRMTLEEKAGQMFQLQIFMGPNGTFDPGDPSRRRGSTVDRVTKKFMTHFNVAFATEETKANAEFVNRLQELAMETRLGIPVTLSTDPRHAFQENVAAGFSAGTFSQWPEPIGLAAIRDVDLVRKFGEIAREEYIAMGIRVALHPQVDVTTEPRWSRTNHGFGEDAHLTAELVEAYIQGFQGRGNFGAHSVSTVTKHFPGGGPAESGEDSHFSYGKNSSYPGNNFEYHLIPFKAAIAAGTRQIMPYYSRPQGTQYDSVGWAFQRQVVTELLREELGFDGIVLTDWSIITGSSATGELIPPRAWGVENLTELERAALVLDAGCDQIGGEERPDIIIELVRRGIVPEKRIDQSVRRLLREKFLLGLFENPFLDVDMSEKMVGNAYFKKLGEEAQRRACTLLTNKGSILPLQPGPETKFFIEGFNVTYMDKRHLTVVETPEEADYALLRLEAPYEPRNGTVERNFHAGSLAYPPSEQKRQAAIYESVPTIVDMLLDRPAIIPEVVEGASALLGSYGSSPDAFLDIVLGIASPGGKLPFDLPRSMEAVKASMEDVPFDTRDPVFKFGHGLSYSTACCPKPT